MKENKIEKWINDGYENKAYPIMILKVNDEDIENIFNSIKKLNNRKRHFFFFFIDLTYEQFQFSPINQILIIKKNHYIFTKEMQKHIKKGCIYIEDNDSINKFIYALGNNDIHLCEDIKCEVIEKIDFSIILQDKHNLTKFFLNKVEILKKIGIYTLDKQIEYYMLVLDHYVKKNIISANLIHKLYQITNLDFESSSRAIGDRISLICGVKSKAIHFLKISLNLRQHVKNNNIKVYDLNFNQSEYDTKLKIAHKLLKIDSKDLNIEKISKITELPLYEINNIYKKLYIC